MSFEAVANVRTVEAISYSNGAGTRPAIPIFELSYQLERFTRRPHGGRATVCALTADGCFRLPFVMLPLLYHMNTTLKNELPARFETPNSLSSIVRSTHLTSSTGPASVRPSDRRGPARAPSLVHPAGRGVSEALDRCPVQYRV